MTGTPVHSFNSLRRPYIIALVFLTLITAFTIQPALAAQDATLPTEGDLPGAVAYLVSQQAEDGGFVGFSGTSDAGTTVDAILAMAAAREAGIEVTEPLERALTFLDGVGLAYGQSGTGAAAKMALAYLAGGRDMQGETPIDPLALVTHGANADTGVFGTGVYDHALGLLALAGYGQPIPQTALDVLETYQITDGSWAFDGTTTAGVGDSNTTAVVIQALVAAGQRGNPMVDKALAYLSTAQAADGGFAYTVADPLVTDANSTGLGVQALIAVGLDPASPEALNALGALAAFQNESGAFRYQNEPPDDNLYATLQAIPALAGLALPIGSRGGDLGTPVASPVALSGAAIDRPAA